MHKLIPFGLLLLLAACSTAAIVEPETPGTESAAPSASIVDPAAAFGVLEDRLLAAETVHFEYHVTSEGAFEVDLQGRLDIALDGEIVLTGKGTFGGEPVELLVRTKKDSYEFGNGSNRKTTPLPPHLKEALLIGLTRMGILHNLARLTAAAPPDRAEGGVREWVTVDTFGRSPGGGDAGDDVPAAVGFEITVSGNRVATAALAIDARGRPVVRHQTVRFPSGEMRVVEKYSAVLIDP